MVLADSFTPWTLYTLPDSFMHHEIRSLFDPESIWTVLEKK
jgi:hypothetical protein